MNWATYIAGAIVVGFGVIWPQHYSESSIISSTIDDDIFGGLWQARRHFVEPYFDETIYHTMTQRERLQLLVEALNVTLSVLEQVNLATFLDAGVLLGWYRHNGSMIPWDIDADVGVITNECLSKYPDQGELERLVRDLLPAPYVLEYMNCEPSMRGNGRDFAGIIADSRNGIKVDIFGFYTVQAVNDTFRWRKNGSWLQRDLDSDSYHKVIPRDAVLPLQWGNFSGISGRFIPNDPKRFLQWDFGFVLDPPIFPFGFSLTVVMAPAATIAVILTLLITGESAPRVVSFLAFFLLDGGYRVVALILIILGLQGVKSSSVGSITSRIFTLSTLSLLSFALQPLAPQLFATCMEAVGAKEFTANKERFCFFYKLICIDS